MHIIHTRLTLPTACVMQLKTPFFETAHTTVDALEFTYNSKVLIVNLQRKLIYSIVYMWKVILKKIDST